MALLKQYGCDSAFNYKTNDTAAALAAAAPDGIDIYFDNVGGETLDVVLAAARPHARIVGCGAISQYDLPEDKRYGAKNLMNVGGRACHTFFTLAVCVVAWLQCTPAAGMHVRLCCCDMCVRSDVGSIR